jgi:hypothetical protein
MMHGQQNIKLTSMSKAATSYIIGSAHNLNTERASEFCDLRDRIVEDKNLDATIIYKSGFGGLVVSMLASGTQDRGFSPGRSRRIFSGEKILSMPSFGREVKPFVPCRRFAVCQRTL